MGYCGQAINGITTDCIGSKGGVKEIWISSLHQPFNLSIDNGIITYINDGSVDAGTGNFHQFKFRKGAASMSSTMTIDSANGLHYVSTDINITFSKMDTPKRLELEKLALANDMVAIVLDNNGHYWYLGKDYPVTLSASKGSTGSKKSDTNSYSVTLNCCSFEYPIETTDKPWEHHGRPPRPILFTEVILYKTYKSDVTSENDWVEDNLNLKGGGYYDLGQEATIKYVGKEIFFGWYDGTNGSLVSKNKEVKIEIDSPFDYYLIARVIKEFETETEEKPDLGDNTTNG